MRSWSRCESGRIEARKRKENGRKEYEESMAAERERVDSIHAHGGQEISIVGLIMRDASDVRPEERRALFNYHCFSPSLQMFPR